MNIIKLNAIDSTNSYLLELSKNVELKDETIVWAKEQNNGRGQRGSTWFSEPEKSLSFSVFKRFNDLSVEGQVLISLSVSLGIINAMKLLHIPNVSIKWPNDILSDNKKLAGILIENQVKVNRIASSIIGIGFNVNNEIFNELPQAGSLFLSTKKKQNLDLVFTTIYTCILEELRNLESRDFSELKVLYESFLFRKDKISVFEDLKGNRFNGIIKGINHLGQLEIEKEDESLQEYNLRELKLLY